MDGWVVTQVVAQPLFKRWTQLIGEPAWLEDPRFAMDQLRGDNRVLLSQRIAQWWTRLRANIPAGPGLSPKQALEHEQVAWHRDFRAHRGGGT